MLKVSDFQILIKSCSIESRNDPSPKSEVVHETKFSLKISYSTHACLTQLDQHQTCKPVMVSVVAENRCLTFGTSVKSTLNGPANGSEVTYSKIQNRLSRAP